ncbi:hypothetical protein [Muricomes intestini]|uniref:hypothetical protein n=1 Tax=Muricomes intestini TaxID=1796634 RepID=UPI002FDEBDF5
MRIGLMQTFLETDQGERKELFVHPNLDWIGSKSQETKAWEVDGYRISIRDNWIRNSACSFELVRRIVGEKLYDSSPGAIAFETRMELEEDSREPIRFGIPSAVYDDTTGERKETRTFMETRLTGCMVLAHKSEEAAIVLKKLNCAREQGIMKREKGQKEFWHNTDITSIGYKKEEKNALCIRWPYEEKDCSPALDSRRTPIKAYYPLGEKFEVELRYEIKEIKEKTFTDSFYEEFKEQALRLDTSEKVIKLPFSREEAMRYRKISLEKSYKEFGKDGAGFFFDFDPQKGYGSQPSGFGTAKNEIPHDTYTHILEYGFTGRELNTALLLSEEDDKWQKRAEKVIDFFVDNCVTDNGWIYSLYDLERERPFASFGDKAAPKLHYMSYDKCEGNYLRTMTEPMFDLLRCVIQFKSFGKEKKRWAEAVDKFAGFLLNVQNKDGSWFRGYDKAGRAAFESSAAAIPVPFLCCCAKHTDDGAKYRKAAEMAGQYLISNDVQAEKYKGGTLDNPDIIDKEAAEYVMAALYHLYKLTEKQEYLEGAKKAARQFVTWNYIWNAPMGLDTILGKKDFHTKGMGAINSVWCGGVVDIYSMFHIKELFLIGDACEDEFMKKMAEWISIATNQIMSYPEDNMGFTDLGMQPEGFGVCPQGMDEGMIRNGDIWGTLGWIYSAGIDGMKRYFDVR